MAITKSWQPLTNRTETLRAIQLSLGLHLDIQREIMSTFGMKAFL